MATQIVLTLEQRKELTTIPDNITDDDLMTFCVFDETDRKNILGLRREFYGSIGYAVQLFCLRYTGWRYDNETQIPRKVLNFIATQLELKEPSTWKFKSYYKRPNTLIQHFHEICRLYGYVTMDEASEQKARRLIASEADIVDNRERIVRNIIDVLRRDRVIMPKISTIERWVLEACSRKEEDINRLICSQLTDSMRHRLDLLLSSSSPSPYIPFTLHQLKEIPGKICPETICEIADRIECIDSLGLTVDVSPINDNMRRIIYRKFSSRRTSSTNRSKKERVYAGLVIYLMETRRKLQDKAIELNDILLNDFHKKGQRRSEKEFAEKRAEIWESHTCFVAILEKVAKAMQDRGSIRKAIESQTTLEELISRLGVARGLMMDEENEVEMMDNYYSRLRRYSPRFLDILTVSSDNEEMQPLIDALAALRTMNASEDAILPENVPTAHITPKWRDKLYKDEKLDKRYYEIDTLLSLRNAVRNNLVTVEGSDKYLSFEQDLIDKETFENATDVFDTISAPTTFDAYIEERIRQMDEVLQNLSENIGMLTDINIKSGRVHVSPHGPAVPKEAEELSRRIYRTMMPEAWLEEIIREVDKWTGFSKYFINKNTKTQEFKEEDVEKILAAITAIGTNVGLEKMSQAMGKFSFSQLYTVVQNCLDESNISKATASIIQHQRALWISEYWGEGNTSSSDGRGIRTVVSTLNAEPNPRHGIEKGCTIYRFVSDKYYTFHTKVISTSREYLHVIDGVLAHELMTGEPVLEHYTDTGGYSDPLFGFAHMLGFIYAPRIKGISRSKLFIFQESEEFSNSEDITFNKIHTDWIKDYYQDILRIAYSIKIGHVTGALVMRKLCNKSSKLRRAIVEMGRIERTIFLLRYFASQELRRKIQAGLNKGEANNNLARVVQFGSEGKFTSKDIERQQVKASALCLLMDAITLWNGTYMQRSVEYLERNGENIDRGLLKHVSPQNFAHISFLGHYSFDESLSLGENEYRKLKIEQN